MRTSIDLELDLRASEVKLGQLHQEIARLEEFKERMESARSQGQLEPAWLSENEQLQQFLAQAGSLVSRALQSLCAFGSLEIYL